MHAQSHFILLVLISLIALLFCSYLTATFKIIVNEDARGQELLTLMVKMRITVTFLGTVC